MKYTGIVALILGFALHYWINRRQFYRRNIAGVEEFSSYEKGFLTKLLEGLGKILSFLLIIGGILFLIGHFLGSLYHVEGK